MTPALYEPSGQHRAAVIKFGLSRLTVDCQLTDSVPYTHRPPPPPVEGSDTHVTVIVLGGGRGGGGGCGWCRAIGSGRSISWE